MLRVGLTGGIGAGKSAVSRLLAEQGAVVIDADLIARQVVEPGTPGLAAVVAEFGAGVLRPDGSLDRDGLGRLVFGDPQARARLNAVVHPLIGEQTARLMADVAADAVVVHDVPLLAEADLAAAYDEVVVVEAPVDVRIERLRERGLPEEQARARMATQASDEDRRAIATRVLDNVGTLDSLRRQVDALWRELARRASAP